MDRFSLDKIVYTFSQEANTSGTTREDSEEGYEQLEITVDTVLNSIDEQGGFLVLRTKGWSIEADSKEFLQLLNLVRNGVKANI